MMTVPSHRDQTISSSTHVWKASFLKVSASHITAVLAQDSHQFSIRNFGVATAPPPRSKEKETECSYLLTVLELFCLLRKFPICYDMNAEKYIYAEK